MLILYCLTLDSHMTYVLICSSAPLPAYLTTYLPSTVLFVRPCTCCAAVECAVLCCFMLFYAVLCCFVLFCVVLFCVVLCCAALCCVVLCFAVLCCVVLCCVLLCCVVGGIDYWQRWMIVLGSFGLIVSIYRGFYSVMLLHASCCRIRQCVSVCGGNDVMQTNETPKSTTTQTDSGMNAKCSSPVEKFPWVWGILDKVLDRLCDKSPARIPAIAPFLV